MPASLKEFGRKTFNRVFFLQLQNYILMGLSFVVPGYIGALLWPSDPENGIMKVVAIFTGSVLFMILITFYKYFSFHLMQLEALEDEKQEVKNDP